MRRRVNPHRAAFPLWICVRLNFSRGGMAASDRPLCKCQRVRAARQPSPGSPSGCCAPLAPVSLTSTSPFSTSCPLSHFYYCFFTSACRKIAHPEVDAGGFCFLRPFLFASKFSSVAPLPLPHITQFHGILSTLYFFLNY